MVRSDGMIACSLLMESSIFSPTDVFGSFSADLEVSKSFTISAISAGSASMTPSLDALEFSTLGWTYDFALSFLHLLQSEWSANSAGYAVISILTGSDRLGTFLVREFSSGLKVSSSLLPQDELPVPTMLVAHENHNDSGTSGGSTGLAVGLSVSLVTTLLLASAVFVISWKRRASEIDEFDELAYDTEMRECPAGDEKAQSNDLEDAPGDVWGNSDDQLWSPEGTEPGNPFVDFRAEESVTLML
jgi:hypothetical protein